MSALTALRRGRLAGAVIPACALAIAGIVVAQSGAQAAPRTPALHAGTSRAPTAARPGTSSPTQLHRVR